MGLVIRKSLATTVFSYLGVVVGYLNILFFFPKFLTTDQIGLYRLVLDCAILLAPFAQSGIMQGIIKYFPQVKNEKEKKGFIIFSFLFFISSIFLFSAILLLLREEILNLLNIVFSSDTRAVANYFDLLLYLIVILSFIAFFEGFARANLSIVLVNFLKDVYIRVLTAVSVFLYFKELISYQGLIYSLLIIYGSAAIILFVQVVYQNKIKFPASFSSLKVNYSTEMIKYSLFMVISTGSNLIIGKIDSLMVSAMLGLGSNGIYTTLFYVAVVVEIPKRAVAQIVVPLYSKAFANEKIKDVYDLYSKSAINQLIIGLLLYIGIVVNLHNLFFFIPNGEEYEIGKWVIVIIGASKVIDMSAGANSELIIMSKHFRFNIYLVASLALLTIITNLLFIPTFGMEGAALASLISLFIFNLVKFIFIYIKFNLQPFSKKTLLVLAIGSFSFVVGYFFPQLENNILDLLIRSILVTIIFGLLIIFTKASTDINNFLSEVLKKISR